MNLVATFPDGKCAPGKLDNQAKCSSSIEFLFIIQI